VDRRRPTAGAGLGRLAARRGGGGYAERGLPETKVADSPALLDTETDARAIVRVRTLIRQLRHKFADRLEEDAIERSWADIADPPA